MAKKRAKKSTKKTTRNTKKKPVKKRKSVKKEVKKTSKSSKKVLKDKYQVVIIGAGPAGLAAARVLKSNKIDFLVIDKKKEIGFPLRCGEGIRTEEFLRLFEKIEYPFVENRVQKSVITYKNIEREFEADYLELDRVKFEKWLAESVKNNIRLETSFEELTFFEDYVEIKNMQNTIKADMIIIATGTNYRVQERLGLAVDKPEIVTCYGGIFSNVKVPRDKFYFHFDDKELGSLWVFPKKKGTANIGYARFMGQTNIYDTFHRMLKKHKIKGKMIKEYAGVYPCKGPIDKTYTSRVLVAGMAAGMVHAGTGEGIYFALESGRIAGKVAAKACFENNFEEEFLASYEKEWKKSFGKIMKAGVIFASLLFLAYQHNLVRQTFESPTQKELRGFIVTGKIPFRASLSWKIADMYGLFDRENYKEGKPPVPKLLKFLWRIIRIFRRKK